MANYDDTSTVSGSIVRVNDGADSVPLKNWLVTLPASLDGYSEVNGYKQGANVIDYASNLTSGTSGGFTFSVTASLGRTIYGGTADLVTGEGSETYGKITDFSALTANGTSSTGAYRYKLTVSNMPDYNTATCVSNILTYRTSFNANAGEFYNATNVFQIFLTQDNVTDAIAYLHNNNVEIVYPKTTPTSFTFAPVTIETAKGSNTFWSDQGNTELTYYKDGYGFTSVTIHKETPDGEPVEQTAKLHRIVYQGQVDVVTGKGTTNYKNFKLSDLTWSGGVIGGQMWCWYVDLSTEGLKLPANSEIFDGLCDSYTPIRYFAISTNANTIALRNNGYLYVNNGSDTVKPTGNVLITLATPAEFTFQPISMETDEGENTLYADEGDSAIVYRKEI